jgi:HrpA-like RNA helicase
MNPHELPVYQQKDKILEALSHNQVIVVESPTGSGKTTQLPIILYEAGYAKKAMIGVTQPRRIAAISVSDFIAKQTGTKVPGLVGYKMRFEDMTTPETAIKIMTDGILLQEMKLDPYMSKYDVIMVDEAHERSLNIDFILGILKKVLESRSDFKVIVSSATINAEVFSEYFGECPIVRIETQTFPVTLIYDPVSDGGLAAAPDGAAASPVFSPGRTVDRRDAIRLNDEAIQDKILSIVTRVIESREPDESGDILIFLPGEKTIKECMKRLAFSPLFPSLLLIPLYSRLGKDEQEKVFDPAPEGKIKVVIATNIAETSVTIDGVTVVIDSGLAKLNYYNPRTFTSSLIETPISKASCNQRKGRAGRTRPGVCYRLYPRKDYENRPLFTTEEIYRTDLSEVVLRMAELGINDFENFDFISKPAKSGISGAVDVLNRLDALNPDLTLSKTGEMMCKFPLLPRLSRMIIESILKYPDVIGEVLIASAFLSTISPYVLPPGEEMEARIAHHSFRDPMGDFVSYLRIYKAFGEAPDKSRFCDKNYMDERTLREIYRIKEQLELIVSGMGVPVSSGGPIYDYLCAVARGLIQFVCARQERGLFRSLTAEKIQIHPGSVMYRENPDFIVAGEIVRTTRMYAMSVSPLPRELLSKISPVLASGMARMLEGRGFAKREMPDRERGRAKAGSRGGISEYAGSESEGREGQISTSDEARDFTNRIKIGGQIFEIESHGKKNRKVLLEWPKFALARAEFEKESGSSHKSLKGTILYGKYTLLDGEKLDTILRIASWLDPEGDLVKDWPRGVNFLATPADASRGTKEASLLDLVENLEHVMQIAKPKSKDPRLGFITLYSDGAGIYWFRISRGFHTALNESVASLESLADYAGDSASPSVKEKIGSLYARLTSFFE